MKPSSTTISDIIAELSNLHAKIIMDGHMEECSQYHIAIALRFICEHTTPAFFSEQEINLLDCVADMALE